MGSTAPEIEREIRAAFPEVGAASGRLRFRVADTFKEFHNAPEGIRPPHAIGAAEHPAAVERYDLDGRFVSVAIAPGGSHDAPFVMVLMIDDSDGETATIINAWRLYDAAEELTPTRALALVIERYGVDIEVDGESGLFAAHVMLPAGVEGGLQLRGGTPDDIRANAFVRRRSSGETDWTWCFAISSIRYRRGMRIKRR